MSLPFELDELGAMTIVAVASDALVSLDLDEMPPPMAQGVMLLYDILMRTAQPHLPKEGLDHINILIQRTRELSQQIRMKSGLPTQQ